MSPTHSPPQPLPGDEDLDKLGFEKVTEEFIGECKSEALLLRHKRQVPKSLPCPTTTKIRSLASFSEPHLRYEE